MPLLYEQPSSKHDLQTWAAEREPTFLPLLNACGCCGRRTNERRELVGGPPGRCLEMVQHALVFHLDEVERCMWLRAVSASRLGGEVNGPFGLHPTAFRIKHSKPPACVLRSDFLV